MQVLRCVVAVDADWRVTIGFPDLGASLDPRAMRRTRWDDDGSTFPLPPADELRPSGAEHPASCQRLCELHEGADAEPLRTERERIIDRRPDTQTGISPFGGYLFHSLIGQSAWDWIKQTAADNNARCLELALVWDRGNANLNRLNWEMMHDGTSFLVAGLPGMGVAVTRLVEGTQEDRWAPRELDFPPSVLFVVGTTLNDPSIRPGAEFLGLLRELKESGRRIRARVLEDAQPRELERVVRVFEPDVVHFICHGNRDLQSGRGYLELVPDESGGERKRYGDQLYASLTVDGRRPPPIVVLSACESGSAEAGPAVLQGAHNVAPLATELVARGIPIVLGMAGRVSDLACRLFTRRLGDALVHGESLIAATAEARRATVSQGRSAEETVDWAFPALFLAQRVEPGYAPVAKGAADTPTLEEGWISDYNLERSPIFCGRSKFFHAYYGFFGPKPKRVLAVVADGQEGVGRTRLLQELTMQALRDGHVPILLSSEAKTWTAPSSIREFGGQLRQAIRRVRKDVLKLESAESQLGLLLNGQPGLDPTIREELEISGELTAGVLRLALQADCFRLVKDARRYEPIEKAGGRALVLLDSVEQYDHLLDELFDHMLDSNGFGTGDEPIPAVLAFSKTQPAASKVQELLERVSSRAWLHQIPLEPFRVEGDEDLFAYSWIVLNPFIDLYEEISVRNVVNDRAEKGVVRMARQLMTKEFAGIPGRLADPSQLNSFTVTALSGEFVLPLGSDDADMEALAAVRIDRDRTS